MMTRSTSNEVRLVPAHPNGWRNPFDRFEVGQECSRFGDRYLIEGKAYWSNGDTQYFLRLLMGGSESLVSGWSSCRWCAAVEQLHQMPVLQAELEPLKEQP